MPHLPHFGHNKNVTSRSNGHLKSPLIMGIRYNFRKTYRTDLDKGSEVLTLGPKNDPFNHFRSNLNFPLKSKAIYEKRNKQI